MAVPPLLPPRGSACVARGFPVPQLAEPKTPVHLHEHPLVGGPASASSPRRLLRAVLPQDAEPSPGCLGSSRLSVGSQRQAQPSPQPGDVTRSPFPLARVALPVFVVCPTGKNSDKGPARNIFLLSGIFSTEILLVDNDGNSVTLEPLRNGCCVPVSEPRLSYPCPAVLNDGEQFFSGTAELFHLVIEKKNDLRPLKRELGQTFV